ncbi:MAG: APC family permease, partial [Gammaproteobacteria bacterium]
VLFTFTKIGALAGLIGLGFLVGQRPEAALHTADFWTPIANGEPIGSLALIPVIATAMVGALFAADAWNNITFAAGEVKNPERNVPLSMAFGVALVILLYLLANMVYLATLPLEAIQQAAEDRVGVAAAEVILGEHAQTIMAIAIMISCFGCNNGLILAGARVYYSMARDGLFFKSIGTLNRYCVPGIALIIQGIWSAVLALPRTYDSASGQYSNLYSNLLDYIVFVVLLFYMLTIAGVFVLRRRRAGAERAVRAFGYPILPAAYILCAGCICLVLLFAEKTRLNAGLGLLLVLAGLPVYRLWRPARA